MAYMTYIRGFALKKTYDAGYGASVLTFEAYLQSTAV
jgi:hypothetical protein